VAEVFRSEVIAAHQGHGAAGAALSLDPDHRGVTGKQLIEVRADVWGQASREVQPFGYALGKLLVFVFGFAHLWCSITGLRLLASVSMLAQGHGSRGALATRGSMMFPRCAVASDRGAACREVREWLT
jgi:hypothetical protein